MAGKVKFTFELNKIKFDRGTFNKDFDEKAQILVRQAAREWVRAVILQVAVWTGFAMGSIKFARGPNGNLGQYLRISIPISPRSNRPRIYYSPDGRKIPKVPERAGVFGRYNFPTAQHRYRFSFRSDVVHFIENEFYQSRSPTSPWHSMRAGREAFYRYLKAHVNDLPRVKDYFVKSKISKK